MARPPTGQLARNVRGFLRGFFLFWIVPFGTAASSTLIRTLSPTLSLAQVGAGLAPHLRRPIVAARTEGAIQ
jgi:hypothetical protein